MSSTPPAPGPARDLVVSYCFPPYVDTAAIVAAKRVRESARPVDVIQNRMSAKRNTTPAWRRLADDILFTNEHQRDFMVEAIEDEGLAAGCCTRP